MHDELADALGSRRVHRLGPDWRQGRADLLVENFRREGKHRLGSAYDILAGVGRSPEEIRG